MQELARTPAAPSSSPAVDRGAVRQLEEQLGRDGLAGLVRTFFDRTPERLAGLRGAAMARDASAMHDAAHSLKASARSFGAAEMAEIAAQIENESAAGSLEGADARVAALAMSFERTRAELEHELAPGSRADSAGAGTPTRLSGDDPVVRGVLAELRGSDLAPEARIARLEAQLASLERSLSDLAARLSR